MKTKTYFSGFLFGISLLAFSAVNVSPAYADNHCPQAHKLIKPSKETGWKKNEIHGYWEKDHKSFRRDDMTKKERARGDVPWKDKSRPSLKNLTQYERGCVGVTNALLGVARENFRLSECFLKESQALARAKTKECKAGKTPKVFGFRYWDRKKSDRKPREDGTYPVDTNEVYRSRKPSGDTRYTNFDFGYRQSDGSYIHADHQAPNMTVYLSPSKKEFSIRVADFNTTLYCVRCATDDCDGQDHHDEEGQGQDSQGTQNDQQD